LIFSELFSQKSHIVEPDSNTFFLEIHINYGKIFSRKYLKKNRTSRDSVFFHFCHHLRSKRRKFFFSSKIQTSFSCIQFVAKFYLFQKIPKKEFFIQNGNGSPDGEKLFCNAIISLSFPGAFKKINISKSKGSVAT